MPASFVISWWVVIFTSDNTLNVLPISFLMACYMKALGTGSAGMFCWHKHNPCLSNSRCYFRKSHLISREIHGGRFFFLVVLVGINFLIPSSTALVNLSKMSSAGVFFVVFDRISSLSAFIWVLSYPNLLSWNHAHIEAFCFVESVKHQALHRQHDDHLGIYQGWLVCWKQEKDYWQGINRVCFHSMWVPWKPERGHHQK